MSSILIIDDDSENRDLLRLRLEAAGFSVAEAANGEEGLARAEDAPPDLILLDVMMPKLDGWKVCSALKQGPKTGRIPVIMLTACNQRIEELRSWESGADEYLAKPWDNVQMLETVRRLLGAGGAT